MEKMTPELYPEMMDNMFEKYQNLKTAIKQDIKRPKKELIDELKLSNQVFNLLYGPMK